MRTLFLNPPSFEGFDGGAGSRWPASREIESYWYPVWLAYPAGMLEDSKLLDAPPHKVSIEQTVAMANDFELLVLFTSSPGFNVDVRIAEMMKDVESEDEGGVSSGRPSPSSRRNLCKASKAIDFVVRREFDYQIANYAKGTPLAELPGVSYWKNGANRSQSRRRRDRKSGRAAVGDESLQARPGLHALQRSVSAESLHFVLHYARLPGHVHVLSVAADALRASLALAVVRRRGGRVQVHARKFPWAQRDFLRRRYLQLSQGARHRAVATSWGR